jgi:AcrR family transcriptional regulator
MIAKHVGIDISTLYYHWGEKADLYEAVITDLNDGIETQFKIIEKKARGKNLAERLDIAIDIMCDYLHQAPEVSNLLLLGYFSKSRTDVSLDEKVAGHIANIAIAMGLAMDREHVSPRAKAQIMTLWNAVLNFISGESFFRPILGVGEPEYLDVVKETLKGLLIPAFTGAGERCCCGSRKDSLNSVVGLDLI